MNELETAKTRYIDKFGGYPIFLLRGLPDNEIIKQLNKAVETGKEIEAPDDDSDY